MVPAQSHKLNNESSSLSSATNVIHDNTIVTSWVYNRDIVMTIFMGKHLRSSVIMYNKDSACDL